MTAKKAQNDAWRDSLGTFFKQKSGGQQPPGAELAAFITQTAIPAFESLREELEKHGRDVTIRETPTSAMISVHFMGSEELTYRVQGRTYPNGVLPYAEVRYRERKGLKFLRVESTFRSGAPDYRLDDVTREEIIGNFIRHYTRHVKTD
jgi:hypothetical protein